MRKLKCLSIIVLIAILLGTISTSVLAATSYTLSEYWTIVRDNGVARGRTISIGVSNVSSAHRNDVLMLDVNGNTLWYGEGVIPYSGQASFYCGPDVYRVAVRIKPANWFGTLTPRTGIATL